MNAAPSSSPRKSPLLAVICSSLWICACDLFHTGFDNIEDARLYTANQASSQDPPTGAITVMNWNIKFAGARVDFFFDCHGQEVLMDSATVYQNLQGLSDAINAVNPDILLAQEVDIKSKRSAYIDQVQWILDHTELNYAAYASQWKADYIPSGGIGRVDSGNVIFSRWPITRATRIALPQIDAQDGFTRYFYLKRNILHTRIQPSGRASVNVLNTHTSAYSVDDTAYRQIQIFQQQLQTLQDRGEIFIAGGDLNTIPPGSTQVSGFSDNVCEDDFLADDFSSKTSWTQGLYDQFIPAVSLTDYISDNTPYFTHSISGSVFWNRKLDYLFSNSPWQTGTTITYQNLSQGGIDSMSLSDHAPISSQWAWP